MFLIIVSTVVAFMMATVMIFVRLKASEKPATVRKIILPPLFMSTGACMYIIPAFRLNMMEVVEAFILGVLLSIFLIKTSKFEQRKRSIYLIPSKSFIFILFGLLIVRIIMKLIIGSTISFGETSGMFFLLAFSMILSWRLAMLYKFKKLQKRMIKRG